MALCPACGNEYSGISYHWQHNPSHIPNISNSLMEISKGLVLGDGYLCQQNNKPYIICNMTNDKFLNHLHDKFGILSSRVEKQLSAEQNAQNHINSGFNKNPNKENYSDIWRWQSRSHKKFSELLSIQKKGVSGIDKFTPISFKYWYCSDGSIENVGVRDRIGIAMSKEFGNEKHVEKKLKDSGLPTPSFWSSSKRSDSSGHRNSAWWNVDKSEKLFKIMGEPLPGFEYKWPDEITY